MSDLIKVMVTQWALVDELKATYIKERNRCLFAQSQYELALSLAETTQTKLNQQRDQNERSRLRSVQA